MVFQPFCGLVYQVNELTSRQVDSKLKYTITHK